MATLMYNDDVSHRHCTFSTADPNTTSKLTRHLVRHLIRHLLPIVQPGLSPWLSSPYQYLW